MKFRFFILSAIFIVVICFCSYTTQDTESKFISYVVNSKKQNLNFYWKNKNGTIISNFKSLKNELENKGEKLVFATNGGMYDKNFNPQGLYIEKGKTLKEIDTIKEANGNFYLQPNGVFYITNKGVPLICKTENFKNSNHIKYATQSGPMLLINGEIHSKFNFGSKNLNIRNGVGILPNGDLLFVMSKEKVNFYDFATYFKSKGCKNALYLDGFVSKTYLPSKKWKQLDGSFGVIIAVTEKIE